MPSSISSIDAPVRLCELAIGQTARLHRAELDHSVAHFLRALGLTDSSEFRLCKAGEPCIIQVRSTRIGLSPSVARRIFVLPTAAKPARP
jgi:Fe2+ transport system protein FeoA